MNDAAPAPTVMVQTPGYRLLGRSVAEAQLRALGLEARSGFDRLLDSARVVQGGRTPHHVLDDSPLGPLRFRPLAHGGVFGPLLGRRFTHPARGEREFVHWLEFEARGAPIARACFVVACRKGPFWLSHFVSRDHAAARSAASLLGAAPIPAPNERGPALAPEVLTQVIAASACAVRRFHDAGGVHGDLHLGNLLLEREGEGWTCRLIDLDRARIGAPPTGDVRMRELMRLWRSVEKAGLASRLGRRARATFLSSYCTGDRALRVALRRHEPRELRRLQRHRLGWRMGARGLARLGLLLALGCGSAEVAESPAASEAARLSLLATGDVGRERIWPRLFEGQLAVAQGMARIDREAPVDALVLLGDNFYFRGLDPAHLLERLRRNLVLPYCRFLALDGPRSHEVADACPLPPEARRPRPVFAVLGNHDLESPESLPLQRETIPAFLPGWRMSSGLAEGIELGSGVSLVLFESEIAIDDPAAIERALVHAVRGTLGPWRILATHRPIATDDHGGVPLGGYPAFVRDALAASGRDVQLVLAGHHHSLQAFALETPTRLLQIGAGSGSRAEPPLAQDPPGSLFGALETGFARVDLVGEGKGERLVVSLYRTAALPLIAWFDAPERIARFEVDPRGHVRSIGP